MAASRSKTPHRPIPGGGTAKGLSRRAFLKTAVAGTAGVAATAATVATPDVAKARTVSLPAAPDCRTAYSLCDMCFNKCGLVASVQGDRIVKLDPNPHYTKSRGMLCARGQAGLGQQYDPDRLTVPLIATGPRGSGQFREASWDEALDLVAKRMLELGEKYTRCGTLFSAGACSQSTFVHRFAEVYGSFNITTHESNCLLSVNRAFMDTFGQVPTPDVLNCKYMVLAGANRYEAIVTPDTMDLNTAVRGGAELVVLDPRYTKTAAMGTRWYPVKPGTDMAFMYAIMHVLIDEELYDKGFVAAKVHGLEQLRAHVKGMDPRWAEGETGIPAADIAEIARGLAKAAPAAMVYPGRRSSDYVDSTQQRRTFAMVNALLGNFDKKGGLLTAQKVPMGSVPVNPPWYDTNPFDRVDGDGMVPLLFKHEGSYAMTQDQILKGEPYPVKGWFFYHHNPAHTGPDRQRTYKMMEQMEFICAVDVLMTDTALHADVVLPSATAFERDDPVGLGQGGPAGLMVAKRDKIVEPLGQCRPIFDICKDLAGRMDLAEHFDFTMDEYRAIQMQDFPPEAIEAMRAEGVWKPEVNPYGAWGDKPIKSKSGKIELYNERYEEKGLDPMPVYTPPTEPSDAGTKRFRLVVGRNAVYTHSGMVNNAVVHPFAPDNPLWLNSEAARGLGVADGQKVRVQSPAGSQTFTAKVTDTIRKDTVYTLTGFGVQSARMSVAHNVGGAISELIETRWDKLTGNAALHETFVTVTPV